MYIAAISALHVHVCVSVPTHTHTHTHTHTTVSVIATTNNIFCKRPVAMVLEAVIYVHVLESECVFLSMQSVIVHGRLPMASYNQSVMEIVFHL